MSWEPPLTNRHLRYFPISKQQTDTAQKYYWRVCHIPHIAVFLIMLFISKGIFRQCFADFPRFVDPTAVGNIL